MGWCWAPVSAEPIDLHSERIFQEIMGFVRKVDFTLLWGEGIKLSSGQEAMQDGNYSARWKVAGNRGDTAALPDQPWIVPYCRNTITELSNSLRLGNERK